MSRSKRTRTDRSSPASMAIRSAWERSAPAPADRAAGSARRSAARLVCVRRPEHRQGDSPVGPAIGQARARWSTASSAHEIDEDQVVIEPQVADYWPATPRLDNADVLVLSRFAYMRRRGKEMVLESPRAGALFKICNPRIATAIAMLSTPQQIKRLRRQDGFPGLELLALLVDCQILFKIDAGSNSGLRPAEGDHNLVLWDFHDLLFHARSTEGRHANPLGGVYPSCRRHASATGGAAPLARKEDRFAASFSAAHSEAISPFARLLHERHSTRSFDDQRPITLAELSWFLDNTARVLSRWRSGRPGDGGPLVAYTVRPYPSAGASYELELYLAVDKCERACPRILSLRRRRTRLGADWRPHA